MILGMSADTFTQVHVILSLVGIVSGLIVAFGMLSANKLDGLAALFLVTTVLTSVTGFFFPAPASCRPMRSAPCVLRLPPGGILAMDLRGGRSGRPLFECLRRNRAGVPEGILPRTAGADPVRAAISVRADRGDAIFIVLAILAVRKFHPRVLSAAKSTPYSP